MSAQRKRSMPGSHGRRGLFWARFFRITLALVIGQGLELAHCQYLVAQEVLLPRFRFEPGRTAVYRVLNEKTIVQEGREQKPYHARIRHTYRRETEKVSPDRATERFRLERLEWTIVGSPNDVDFDSDRPPLANERPEWTELRGLVGRPLRVVLDTRGQVLSVTDVLDAQPLERTAPAANAGPVGTASANANASLGTRFWSDQPLRGLLRAQVAWLPEQAVSAGQSWTHRDEIKMGVINLERSSHVTFVGAERDRWRFSSRMEVHDKPNNGVVVGNQRMVGKVLPEQPGSALILFSPELGMLATLRAEFSFAMKQDSIPLADPAQATSVTQRMTARTLVELLTVDGNPLSTTR